LEKTASKRGPVAKEEEDSESDIEFEDAFGDEFESEEEIENSDQEDGSQDGEEEEEEEDEDMDVDGKQKFAYGGDDEDEAEMAVWRRGIDPLEAGEQLTFDNEAYDMFHRMDVEWPFLTFSFIRDRLGEDRETYPHTFYAAAGTQAESEKDNYINIMKISQLQKTKHDEDSDSDDDDSDSDEDEGKAKSKTQKKKKNGGAKDDDPILEEKRIPANAPINKIKVHGDSRFLAASLADGTVRIWDIMNILSNLNGPSGAVSNLSPIYTCKSHKNEGYALDWSESGRLLSGDCNGLIYETMANEAGVFSTLANPYKGHKASVEDVQWSYTDQNVFGSCSVDKTVILWDTRAGQQKIATTVQVHSSDVNTMAWNRKVGYLLATGSDDHSFKIWDMRSFKADTPVAQYDYHTDAISCVEWNPHEETQLVVSSYDNRVTIWDFSLEADEEDTTTEQPPQLFFEHQGLTDVKEVHWHPQIPHAVVCIGLEGMHIFRTSNATEVPLFDEE